MLRGIRSALRDQWMGALALFIVLSSGTAYAAGSIFSADIVDGEVKTVDLAVAAVTSAKVLDNSLKGVDIDESSLTASRIVGPEAWRPVAAASTTGDACATSSGVFCTHMEVTSGGPQPVPWSNYGGAFADAAYYRDQIGVVHLKGLVSNAELQVGPDVIEYPILRLPAGYRPATRRVFASVGGSFPTQAEVAPGRVDIQPNGLVTLVTACGADDAGSPECSATGSDVTLDGITFRMGG